MGLALLNTPPQPSVRLAESFDEAESAAATIPVSPQALLRREAAERLAAHRTRRARIAPQPGSEMLSSAAAPAPRTVRIAAAVAERYARTQSYRAFLAAEAERALRQSQEAAQTAAALTAELAASHARAFAEAEAEAEAERQILLGVEAAAREIALLDETFQASASKATSVLAETISLSARPLEQNLFPEDELAQFPAAPTSASAASAPTGPRTTGKVPATGSNAFAPSLKASATPTVSRQHDGLTIRLDDRLVPGGVVRAKSAAPTRPFTDPLPDPALLQSLDDEIAFRHDPVFEEPAGPPLPLPANLIEFPRQLVAPRKARPRVAEGPLRDEPAPAAGQLRIFEVDCTDISTTPTAAEPNPALDTRQWSSLWLDAATHQASAEPAAPPDASANIAAHQPIALHPARLSRRMLAAALDLGVVAMATASFFATAAATALHVARTAVMQASTPLLTRTTVAGIPLAEALIATAAIFAVLYIVYRSVFFTLSDATPGMRRARIALCTFTDENPTRPLRRRRLFALALAACPFGLGLLWACLDPDRLAWHDRISRTYQRSY